MKISKSQIQQEIRKLCRNKKMKFKINEKKKITKSPFKIQLKMKKTKRNIEKGFYRLNLTKNNLKEME